LCSKGWLQFAQRFISHDIISDKSSVLDVEASEKWHGSVTLIVCTRCIRHEL